MLFLTVEKDKLTTIAIIHLLAKLQTCIRKVQGDIGEQ